MIANHFVAAYQQVGDFKAVDIGGKVQKNGGNVASHFLTADGRVIHSVTGPVSPSRLLDETRWVLRLREASARMTSSQLERFVATVHHQAEWSPSDIRDRKVHELYSAYPLPPLELVYRHVFVKILGERISDAGPRLAIARNRLQFAKRHNRPLLFVLYQGNQWNLPTMPPAVQKLLSQHVVIAMPLREGPALSQLTGQPPFRGPPNASPLVVVADSDARPLATFAGWNPQPLGQALARNYVADLEQNPPGLRQLLQAQRLVETVDPTTARRLEAFTIEHRKSLQEARESRHRESRLL